MRDNDLIAFPILQTRRLTLRQLSAGDHPEIYALRSDVNVNRYLDRKPSRSFADAKDFIKAVLANSSQNTSVYWAITWKDRAELIGTICLFNFSNDHLMAEIGFELLPAFQGKGIMQEAASKVIAYALHDLGLTTIDAYTHADNQGSIRLLTRLHFKKHHTIDEQLLQFRWTQNDTNFSSNDVPLK